MKILCKYDELLPLDKFIEHPKNPNKHDEPQIKRLAELYKYHGIRHPIIVSKLSGFIVAGHGRLSSARLAGLKEFPVEYQDFDSDEAEYAFLVADNAISSWSELDLASINLEIPALGPDFDIDYLGLKDFTIDISEKQDGLGDEDLYTKKILAPIYEPKGERPPIHELYDRAKTDELIAELKAMEIPEDIKNFLSLAAQRHIIFNYEKIAEYYSHAPIEIKTEMEKSALVIIDFNKAIEYGFITMTKEIAEAYPSADYE
jgi:hypothetical protein